MTSKIALQRKGNLFARDRWWQIGHQNFNNRIHLSGNPRLSLTSRGPINLWHARNRLAPELHREARSTSGTRATGWRRSSTARPDQPLARAQQVGAGAPPRGPINLWRARNRLAPELHREARSTSGARATGWRRSSTARPVQPLARAQQVGANLQEHRRGSERVELSGRSTITDGYSRLPVN